MFYFKVLRSTSSFLTLCAVALPECTFDCFAKDDSLVRFFSIVCPRVPSVTIVCASSGHKCPIFEGIQHWRNRAPGCHTHLWVCASHQCAHGFAITRKRIWQRWQSWVALSRPCSECRRLAVADLSQHFCLSNKVLVPLTAFFLFLVHLVLYLSCSASRKKECLRLSAICSS